MCTINSSCMIIFPTVTIGGRQQLAKIVKTRDKGNEATNENFLKVCFQLHYMHILFNVLPLQKNSLFRPPPHKHGFRIVRNLARRQIFDTGEFLEHLFFTVNVLTTDSSNACVMRLTLIFPNCDFFRKRRHFLNVDILTFALLLTLRSPRKGTGDQHLLVVIQAVMVQHRIEHINATSNTFTVIFYIFI